MHPSLGIRKCAALAVVFTSGACTSLFGGDTAGLSVDAALVDLGDDAVPADLPPASSDLSGGVAPDLAAAPDLAVQPAVSFAAPLPIATSCTGYLLLADFNADGHRDLAVYDGSQVCVLLGKGDGTFAKEVIAAAPSFGLGPLHGPGGTNDIFDGLDRVDTADFNGDNKLDLVAGHQGGASVLLGKGDGTFAAAVQQERPMLLPGDGLATAGDFDLDGRADFLLLSQQNGVELWSGRGDGTFAAPIDLLSIGANKGVTEPVWDLTRGDVEGKGVMNYSFLWHFNGGRQVDLWHDKTPLRNERFTTPFPSGPLVAGGDVDRDGAEDLAAAYQDAALVVNGLPVFHYVVSMVQNQLQTDLTHTRLEGLALADLNGDGAADVVTPTVAWLSNGDRSFQPKAVFNGGLPSRRLAAGDLTGDGKADLVLWTAMGLAALPSTSQ